MSLMITRFTHFLIPAILFMIDHMWARLTQHIGQKYVPLQCSHELALIIKQPAHTLQPARLEVKLDRLPVELLDEIFQLACIDGGYTGTSLSMVSQHIRTTSRAARFHSVMLLSGSCRKAQQFLDCFHNARREAADEKGAHLRIRHLCLSLTQDAPISLPGGIHSNAFDPYYWFDLKLLGECWSKYNIGTGGDYSIATQAILTLASGDVETLCLYGHREWGGKPTAIYVQGGFPKLRQLSFAGDEPVFCLSPNVQEPIFPVLDRLHIVTETLQPVDFERWLKQSPHLTSLRVTCDGCFVRPTWMNNFQAMLKSAMLETRGEDCLRILLTMKPVPVLYSTAIADRYHAVAKSLHEDFEKARIPIVFVPYYAFQDIDSRLAERSDGVNELLRRDWTSRITGQAGVFLDQLWYESREDGLVNRIRMRWLYGNRYMTPLVTGR